MKNIYIAPFTEVLECEGIQYLALSNQFDGGHIDTNPGSMDEGDGDDAAVKEDYLFDF